MGVEEGGIAVAFVERERGVALDIMEGAGLDEGFDALAEVAAEAGFVGGADAEIFVHVEKGNLLPVNAGHGDEALEEFDLRIARGEDGGGGAVFLEGGLEAGVDLVGGELRERGAVGEDFDGEGVNSKFPRGDGRDILFSGHERQTLESRRTQRNHFRAVKLGGR